MGERRKNLKERRGLERQLQNLQSKVQQSDMKATQLVQAQEGMRWKWETEMALEKDTLQKQVERLTMENRSIKERSHNLIAGARGGESLGLPAGALGTTVVRIGSGGSPTLT